MVSIDWSVPLTCIAPCMSQFVAPAMELKIVLHCQGKKVIADEDIEEKECVKGVL